MLLLSCLISKDTILKPSIFSLSVSDTLCGLIWGKKTLGPPVSLNLHSVDFGGLFLLIFEPFVMLLLLDLICIYSVM